MQINPIPQNVYCAEYQTGTNVSSAAFDDTLKKVTSNTCESNTAILTLHGKNDGEEGDEFVGSWVSVQAGVTTSVYKPEDFSDENPYYRVKIWKPNGDMEERLVDVAHFNPQSADSFEHYAFACYLEKEEGQSVTNALGVLGGNIEKSIDELSYKRDWSAAYKSRMQELYDAQCYDGYFRYKAMYERLLKQLQQVDLFGVI